MMKLASDNIILSVDYFKTQALHAIFLRILKKIQASFRVIFEIKRCFKFTSLRCRSSACLRAWKDEEQKEKEDWYFMVLPIYTELNVTETADYTASIIVPLQPEKFSK